MRPTFALLGALLAFILPASATADPPGPLSEPVYNESVVEEFRVDSRHGSIYGWVERPVVPEGVQVPVILTYSPYAATHAPLPGEDLSGINEFFVPRGYARAWVHLVGTANSGGCYDYGGTRERESGYDVVEWLGARPWSNGNVGMIGVSYEGTTQWAAAVEAPPHLKAIIPQAAISRWYDYNFQQGVRLLSGSGTPAGFDFGFGQVPIPNTQPHPQALGESIRPCDELEHMQRGYLPDPVYDEFWLDRDYLIRAQNIRAAVLVEHGWQDYNVHPINAVQMWHALPAGLESRLVAGQYRHASARFENAAEIRHAFFDHHLLGRPDVLGEVPRVWSEIALDDTIAGSQLWPPRGTASRRYRLSGGADPLTLTMERDGDSTWTDSDPALSESDVIDPESEEEGLTFISEPLPPETRIAGTPVLDLAVTTSADQTFVTPVLFVEKPDGTREVITRATLNSRNRNSEAKSELVAPGETWRGRARFQPLDLLLEGGSKLGLAVMSMNSAEVAYPDSSRATNTLDLETSTLELPIAPLVEAPVAAAPPTPGPKPALRQRAIARILSARRAGRSVRVRVRCLATTRCRIKAGGRAKKVAPGKTITLRLRKTRRVTVRVSADGRTITLKRRVAGVARARGRG